MYHFKWASKLRLHRQYPHVHWMHVLCIVNWNGMSVFYISGMYHSPPITLPILVTVRQCTYSVLIYSVVRHSRQRNWLAFVSDVHKLLILLTWIHDWCRDKDTNTHHPLQFSFIVSCNHMICKHVLFTGHVEYTIW